jgi:hypothetical protein
VPGRVPLTTLLSWVWIAQVIETDNAFEVASADRVGEHFRISFAMWANCLRWLDDTGVPVDELRQRARAACNLGGLERWGWVTLGDVAGGRRDGYGTSRGITGATLVRPTRAGAYARTLWPAAVRGVEQRWQARFGADQIDALRHALSTLAAPMPWSLPEVQPTDGFLTHVVAGSSDPSDRDGEEVPLVALLAQVLTSLTLEHEAAAKVSLPLGATVLRVIGADAVAVGDLPRLTGLSKEGIAMAAGYLQRRDLAAAGPGRHLHLTPKGVQALADYELRSARPDQAELRQSLEAIVANRDALSAGLEPPEGCWRGAKPYLTQTQRLVADPTGALPWQPMVLHRGGWPDAA